MPSSRELFIRILIVIGYKDNKEAFSDQFFRNIYLQSLLDLMLVLPSPIQDDIKKKIAMEIQDLESIGIILRHHFSEEELQKALEEASKNAVVDFLQKINNSLSDNQREELKKLLEEVSVS